MEDLSKNLIEEMNNDIWKEVLDQSLKEDKSRKRWKEKVPAQSEEQLKKEDLPQILKEESKNDQTLKEDKSKKRWKEKVPAPSEGNLKYKKKEEDDLCQNLKEDEKKNRCREKVPAQSEEQLKYKKKEEEDIPQNIKEDRDLEGEDEKKNRWREKVPAQSEEQLKYKKKEEDLLQNLKVDEKNRWREKVPAQSEEQFKYKKKEEEDIPQNLKEDRDEKMESEAEMTPFELLVIDEAAQLKECESAIPLQLPDIRHAILIGDERQLPAMVKSKISEKAEFGKSLFQRKDVWVLFIAYGKEEFHGGQSLKNMVEVFVVSEVVSKLFKASVAKRQRVSVVVISAQVFALQEKLGNKYSTNSNFTVSVRSVDGFQGGEEDVIITLQSDLMGMDQWVSFPILNGLTYCLWILGNGQTLINGGSIWKELVINAKNRGCFYIADEDKSLVDAILAALVEHGQLYDFLNMDSLVFRNARWKCLVLSIKFFLRHTVTSGDFPVLTAYLLLTSSSHVDHECQDSEGSVYSADEAFKWFAPSHKQRNLNFVDGTSQSLEQYTVNGLLKLVWTIDVLEENSNYIQVLKVWDILPSPNIPELAKHLNILFGNYTVANMNRCKFECVEVKLVVPMSWPICSDSVWPTNLQKAEPVESLSSHLASLNLGEEPTAPSRVSSPSELYAGGLDSHSYSSSMAV
ncbi:hypothetical protein HHK36_014660 [Tetracentron sinense]|uniref:DNA2/NAM7 helicase-like C-terminal domain-containing protein n=1 Tax=Tetracentron sinense TaxID=13715 RepID=A0A834Z4T6_TETSI|nr:hypothetical protein HHK36_014660 [Tetracentron sinense]